MLTLYFCLLCPTLGTGIWLQQKEKLQGEAFIFWSLEKATGLAGNIICFWTITSKKSERKRGWLLIYCTAVSENKAKYCWEICALAFVGQSSVQSLCEQNLLIHFSCQVVDCVLRTFFFASTSAVMMPYALQNVMPINYMRSDLINI